MAIELEVTRVWPPCSICKHARERHTPDGCLDCTGLEAFGLHAYLAL